MCLQTGPNVGYVDDYERNKPVAFGEGEEGIQGLCPSTGSGHGEFACPEPAEGSNRVDSLLSEHRLRSAEPH